MVSTSMTVCWYQQGRPALFFRMLVATPFVLKGVDRWIHFPLFFLYWHTQLILFCLLLSSTLCFSSSFPIPLLLSCVIFLPLTELLPLSSHFKTEWFLTWAKKICWWQYSWTVAGLGVNRKSLYSLVSQVALEPALLYKGSTSILAAHKNTAKQRRKGWDSSPVLPEFKGVPVIHFSVRKLSPQI